ncbi:MAG TPA: hypothetical protein PKX12_16125 [Spirochaetota bacterium]|nr:hypothetical protein [Spirochaetota bacterium]
MISVKALDTSLQLKWMMLIQHIQQYSAAWQLIAEDIRRCLIRRFPYGIIYTVLEGGIIVLSIMNLRKTPESWKLQV